MFAAKGVIAGSYIASIYDPSAQAFITAAGITDDTQKTAINDLVIAAKANGWWTLCSAIYPMVGGTSTTCKYNLKDPRDLDAAYRLTFSGTWVFSSTGALPDGSTAYADSNLNPDGLINFNNSHLSYYSRTDTFGSSCFPIGCNLIAVRFTVRYFAIANMVAEADDEAIGNSASAIVTNTKGHLMTSRVSSTELDMIINGSVAATNTVANSAVIPAFTVYLGARNNTGSAANFSTFECAFATIGTGINSTIAALMYTDIQNFNTTLARQV